MSDLCNYIQKIISLSQLGNISMHIYVVNVFILLCAIVHVYVHVQVEYCSSRVCCVHELHPKLYVQQGTCTHSTHTLGRTCYQDELLIKDRHLLYMHRAEVEAHPGRVTCPHPGSIPHGSRRRTLPRCWCRGPSSCGGQTGTHQGLQMERNVVL